MYVDVDTIIKLAALIGALTTIFILVKKVLAQMEQPKKNEGDIKALRDEHKKDIEAIQKEQQLICFCLLATLDGLKQLGANGDVTKAHNRLQNYLNNTAHEWDGD